MLNIYHQLCRLISLRANSQDKIVNEAGMNVGAHAGNLQHDHQQEQIRPMFISDFVQELREEHQFRKSLDTCPSAEPVLLILHQSP